ncbi:MAG: ABC transporter ATP-binding protein/permease [Desulfobacterota bacterium]|jgi:ABC-type multidrug transport system fused ATPase/permease subunit|nr:ABC transporter ATP-binding protein/permease [Thermodesulfobacteriota bacterium]
MIFEHRFFFQFGIQRKHLTVLLLLGILAALFEGVGVSILLPILEYLQAQGDLASLQGATIWKSIIQVFTVFRLPVTLTTLLLAAFLMIVLRQISIYSHSVYSAYLREKVNASVRVKGFSSFIRADYSYVTETGGSQVVSAVTIESMRAANGLLAYYTLIWHVILVAMYVLIMVQISWQMTVFACLVLSSVSLAAKVLMQRSAAGGRQVTQLNRNLAKFLVEKISAVRTVTLNVATEREISRVEALCLQLRSEMYNLMKLSAKLDVLVEPVIVLAALVILFVAVQHFKMSLAHVALFMFILMRLMPIAKGLLKARQNIAQVEASILTIKGMIEAAQKARSIIGGDKAFVRPRIGIEFSGVCFQYHENGPEVLHDVQVVIPAGSMTAIVGRSGAGKTTLVDLLPRLREPTRGVIMIDRVATKEFRLDELRRNIAFVSQEDTLFDDTLYENICYGKPSATREEVERAAMKAYVTEFLGRLPQGYETLVGERGVRLSGGQKQRISLARALLLDVGILVMDEPTSALDSESEQYIQKSIAEIRERRDTTLIVIAHRISTIREADQIIVLDNGRVVECGTHGELMHGDEWYAEMTRLQVAS